MEQTNAQALLHEAIDQLHPDDVDQVLDFVSHLNIKRKIRQSETKKAEEERVAAIKSALRSLQKSGAFSDIKDPVAWQREIRKDRPLPGREA